jgi:hypothetical protein
MLAQFDWLLTITPFYLGSIRVDGDVVPVRVAGACAVVEGVELDGDAIVDPDNKPPPAPPTLLLTACRWSLVA